MKNLVGKTVLVTGGARGIGKEIARAFGGCGCSLVLADIDSEGLEETAKEFDQSGFEVLTLAADLSSPEEAKGVVDRALEKTGGIDILVNNAGIIYGGPVTGISTEHVQHTIAVNLIAPITLTQRVLPHMTQRGSGHIVNIASLAGWAAPPRVSVYSATKGGLISFTDSIMQELYGTGVRTTIVCPNFVNTGLFEGCKRHPLWQWTTAEEVARRVLRAVKKNQAEVYIPHYMYIWAVIRAACMAKFAYFLGRVVMAQKMTSRWMGRTPETDNE